MALAADIIDYQAAFANSPVGLAIAVHRVIFDCNRIFAETFRGKRRTFIGRTFQLVYPTQEDFETTGSRVAPLLGRSGIYADDRLMRRLDGQLFWCHVSGYAFDRRSPFARTVWSFTDVSHQRSVLSDTKASLTQRERDVCALLVDGKTSKEIALALGISHRTVEVHRASLLRKYAVSSSPALIARLLQE